MKTCEMNYFIHNPIIMIFCEIEDLRDLVVAEYNLYTILQLLIFTLKTIHKTADFEDDCLPLG